MKELISLELNIKFIFEYSRERVSFLDLEVDIMKRKLIASLFVKSSDCQQQLYYLSCHPEHSERLIIYTRILRLRFLEKDFEGKPSEMKSWFLKTDYPKQIVDCKMKKVNFRNSKIESGMN